ncbi:ABC transporter permease [Allokutzneria albata]|nr:ABC transporter permease [Allokutzneria albata]
MLRRNLLHARRYPSMTISTVAMPVLMLLLFVGVFGGALGTGIGGASYVGSYVDYVGPGIILMAATSGSVATAVSVSVDMTEGIVNRFRTMAISRTAVLTGHVVGGVIQTMTSIALVVAVALLMGFRPTAGPLDWLGAAGLLLAMTFAMSWLAAAFGLVTKGPESASNAPMPLMFLPMLGSGFVPPEQMPGPVRWFAEHQPFTPIIETLRGLLMGTPLSAATGALALGWCALISLTGFLWARRAFSRAVTR